MIYIVLLNILLKLWAYVQRDNGLVMMGAGLEPRLWWYMEAFDPCNVTPPSQNPSTRASMSSHPCHQTHCIDSLLPQMQK
jgi:hypothetical protein